ncbi:MAG: enoyl-CoA hydratase/carnithine racemase [Acidimicrobiales bacterium]|jgi:enoyl-CoA hydratase/carnithine racemase
MTTENANDPVLYEVRDSVALVTLNRPERLNAWNGELGTAYFNYLDQAEADPEVKVIVVTGAGRGFCAGADMDVLQGIEAGGSSGPRETRDATYAMGKGKLIIAAVNGACAGLGFVHAVACDMRFAAAGAKFTSAFSRRGLIAEHGSSWTLPRLVGQATAMDLLVSGRVFLAEEALEMGLVNKVFPAESLIDETMAYAKDVAANVAPGSIAVIKQQVYNHPGMALADAMVESNRFMKESLKRPDFKEGVSSFLEKRPPQFDPYTGS